MSEVTECRSDLFEDIKWLKEQVSSKGTPLDTRIEAAMVLWELSEVARSALDTFKRDLRAEASQTGQSRWCYKTGNIQATVVTPDNRVSLKKEADITSLRGTPEYEELIEERTTYRVRQNANTSDLPDHWLDALSVGNPTPRVSLTRIAGSSDNVD